MATTSLLVCDDSAMARKQLLRGAEKVIGRLGQLVRIDIVVSQRGLDQLLPLHAVGCIESTDHNHKPTDDGEHQNELAQIHRTIIFIQDSNLKHLQSRSTAAKHRTTSAKFTFAAAGHRPQGARKTCAASMRLHPNRAFVPAPRRGTAGYLLRTMHWLRT